MALPFIALALAGCNNSKLKYEGNFKLDPGQPSRSLEIDAPKKDQKVAIEISASEPVSVEVVLDKDKGKSKPRAMRTNTKSFNEVVDIPANEKFMIVVSLAGQKEAQVTVKANNAN